MAELLWSVREAMERGEADMLQGIIDRPKQKAKEEYYILKHSNWTGNGLDTLKSTYMLRSTKPPKMLGTVLWHVNNKKGTIDKIWELPLDVDCDREFLDPHNPQEIVHNSASDIKGAIQVI
jgi:hypothetical protein